MIIDAVIRNLEIIREAVNKIPLVLKNDIPSIRWNDPDDHVKCGSLSRSVLPHDRNLGAGADGKIRFVEDYFSLIELESDVVEPDDGLVFSHEKNRQVVGGKVISGEIVKNARIEILRNDAVIGQGL